MRSVVFAGALVLASTPAFAATVLEYKTEPSTSNATLAPSAVGAGVTASNIEAGPGLEANAGGTWNWRDWLNPDNSVNTSAAEARNTNHYWKWDFSSTQAYDLTDLDIRLDRSSTGPNEFALGFSSGGAIMTVLTDNFGDTASGRNYLNVDMSAYSGVTNGTFVLAAWGADSGGATSGGTFDLENINSVTNPGYAFQLRGNAASPAAVPLPAALPLLLAGLGGLAMMRRRQQG